MSLNRCWSAGRNRAGYMLASLLVTLLAVFFFPVLVDDRTSVSVSSNESPHLTTNVPEVFVVL